MSHSIKVLPQDVVNQIAAGEVVERPAHLIKELIENSLDAESSVIHIEVSSGGRFIKISDNGTGIRKADLALALTRHATSKINTTDDIWNLSTFGFRGEALASASAISKLQLTSKSQDEEASYQVRSDFGKISSPLSGNKTQGTEILIEDLFQNVPARLKFLKSENSEYAQVKNVVKAMALLNPEVEFKLVSNGQLDLFYNKKQNAADRIQDILGVKKVYYHQAARGTYRAEAYFCSPEDVAKTSKNIWIFAQKRWVQDRGLQAAVMEAYRSLLMHGEYPMCVVHLHCDPQDIDVNIHPTKSQVKFQDSSLAFRAVQASLREGLEKAPWIERGSNASVGSAPRYGSGVQGVDVQGVSSQGPSSSQASGFQEKGFFQDGQNVFAKMGDKSSTMSAQSTTSLSFDDPSFNYTQLKQKNYNIKDQLSQLRVGDEVANYKASNQKGDEGFEKQLGYWSQFHVIGQLHLTYIVCQKDDKLILVDQHAAHERVAFEKLMYHWQSPDNKYFDLQAYLFPLAIDLNPEKVDALMSVQDSLERMGIIIEVLGPQTVGVKSAPSFIKDGVYGQIFEKMAEDIIEYGGSHRLDRAIGDIFATMACHSVVRAGQSLSLEEMKSLLIEMDQFPLSSFCPHGRPVSVELGIQEIEKMFGRIV